MPTSKTKYDESSIDWLQGLEGIQKRPTMYVGSVDSEGILHLVKEIVGNSIDESANGHGKHIGISIQNSVVTVFDNGRGIPSGPHPKFKGKSTLTILATEIHAGGKLSDNGQYKTSIGLNGVGLSAVNALSETLTVWSMRGKSGGMKTQSFKRGKPVGKVVAFSPNDRPKLNGNAWHKQGTIIQWEHNTSIFEKKAKLDTDAVLQFLEFTSWFCSVKGKPVKFEIQIGKKTTIFENGGRLDEYPEHRMKALKLKPIEDTAFLHTSESTDMSIQWADTTTPMKLDSSISAMQTMHGGAHVEAMKRGILAAFTKKAGKKYPFHAQDITAGVVGCLNFRVAEPMFDSQSKHRYRDTTGAKVLITEIEAAMTKWIGKNKETAQWLIERAHALYSLRSDSAINKELSKLLAPKKGSKSLLPFKLIGSRTKDPEQRELYLLEGDSAGGTSKKASNRDTQEILPLRGKMMNAYRKGIEKLAGSEAILDILKSIGYNPAKPDQPLRVGRIITLADPDPDGAHITSLLLGLLNYLMPHLFEEGRVFVVDAPLYVYSSPKGEKVYAADMKELVSTVKGKLDQTRITRVKGYGEMNHDDLRVVAFDTGTRRLLRITPEEASGYVQSLMGDDTLERKKLMGLA